jgi:hypothetical protein
MEPEADDSPEDRVAHAGEEEEVTRRNHEMQQPLRHRPVASQSGEMDEHHGDRDQRQEGHKPRQDDGQAAGSDLWSEHAGRPHDFPDAEEHDAEDAEQEEWAPAAPRTARRGVRRLPQVAFVL